MPIPHLLAFAVVATALSACSTVAGPAAAHTGPPPPMKLDGDDGSPWAYLRDKYDGDGDGRITPAEYEREGTGFDRLDRDDDGAITAADFRRGGGMAAMMRGMRAQRVVSTYFQTGDPGTLRLDELEDAAAAYDDDGDGAVSQREFDAHARSRRVEPPGDERMIRMAMRGVEPWAVLADAVDADGDGRLSRQELVSYFEARDDGDLVWSLDRARRGPATRRMSGPPEGELAPDFTLEPPEGGEAVTLSAFRRNLPVALIFGSYT